MITQETQELSILKKLFERKSFHQLLDFLIYPILTGNQNSDKDFLYGIGVERTSLNFENGQKPGDFDLIIIPLSKGKPLIEYVGVLEVKVSRPRLNKLGKHPNFSGKDQILGLLNDDFPFVGLLHLIIPEKDYSPEYLHRLPNSAVMNGVDISNSIILEDRQVGRIKKLQLPEPVGYAASVIYDYENCSLSGSSNYKFCEQRVCNFGMIQKRISYALKSHANDFIYYSKRNR